MDIGFDGSGNLDTATLLTFVGSGDGFVTRWYDQAEFGGDQGDGRDSSDAQHPRIVSSGALVTSDNGKVALDFAGDKSLTSFNFDVTTTTVFAVSSIDTTSGSDSVAERIFNFSDDGSSRFSLGREDGFSVNRD